MGLLSEKVVLTILESSLSQNQFNQINTFVALDADGDGIADRADPDDDNDQIPDYIDQFPFVSIRIN